MVTETRWEGVRGVSMREKRRRTDKERKVNGKKECVMKATTGKLLKKNELNHQCTTALSVPSLEVLDSVFCITSDWPESQPEEKQYSCLGQQPGCCLPKNIFIQLEVTILCFWTCNISHQPRALTYSFWKCRSDMSFSSSFWLKSFYEKTSKKKKILRKFWAKPIFWPLISNNKGENNCKWREQRHTEVTLRRLFTFPNKRLEQDDDSCNIDKQKQINQENK